MAGRIIWGVFLITVGLGLVVFNKPYAAWVGRVIPRNPYAREPMGRPLAISVGVVMIVAGVSAIVSVHGQVG